MVMDITSPKFGRKRIRSVRDMIFFAVFWGGVFATRHTSVGAGGYAAVGGGGGGGWREEGGD